MRFRLLICSLSLLAIALLAGNARQASAVSAAQQLPLTWFHSMVVDPDHGHVFITGRQDDVIAVRNADGSDAGTITGETKAGGMVLDGSNLYVARCDGSDTIDVIDTATLTKVDSIAATVDSCFIAEAGGRLWYGSGTAPSMVLTSVPLDGSAAETPTSVPVDDPEFATTPVHPNWLVFGGIGSSGSVSVYDVSDASTPSLLAAKTGLGGGQNLGQLAITSDGNTLLMADGAIQGVAAFALPDMNTAQGVYALTGTGVHTMGIAVSPVGNHIAGSGSGSGDFVKVFDQGDTTPKRTTVLGDAYSLNHGSIQYSADGNSIYAVSNQGSGHVFLHVLPGLPGGPGSLTIKSSAATITAGKSVTVTAHLGTASANKTVSIYRTPYGGSPALVRTAVAGSLGNVGVVVRPGVLTTYYAVWEGDSTHSETTSATITVHVRVVMHAAAQSGYRTLRGVRLYHYNGRCPAAGHVGCPSFLLYATPAHAGANLTYVVQAFYGRRWHTVLSGSHVAGTTGKLILKVIYPNRSYVGINQRVHVSMPGDADHLGGTSAWTNFRITS